MSPRPGGSKSDMPQATNAKGKRDITCLFLTPDDSAPHPSLFRSRIQEGREDQKGAGAFDKGRVCWYLQEGVVLRLA